MSTPARPARVVKRALVTGGAGFIGSHLVDALLQKGVEVVVLDNFDEFYEEELKRENVQRHAKNQGYRLFKGDIRNERSLSEVFDSGPFDSIVHLAALAGVRD